MSIFYTGNIKRLESVFRRLKGHNLNLKGKKCEFFKTEIKYLGFIVSDDGIKTDPDMVSVVKNWFCRNFLTFYLRLSFVCGMTNQ
jgi:hypothetical protein